MSSPRLVIDLGKIENNARTLVERLAARRIAVTGVTKATLGLPEIARALVRGGATRLADSRIENLRALRRAGLSAPMTLIRSPMLSQVDGVVAHADVSFNTELEVIGGLSSAAVRAGKSHTVVLMVELGDLREGILPSDLEHTVRETLRLPNIALQGIGANLACRSGVVPGPENMAELSTLADSIEATFGLEFGIVSGGNSANLHWALGSTDVGRINDLRLGEALLLSCDPLTRESISGLDTDAITLTAEVIEAKLKPSLPRGEVGQSAFGKPRHATDRGPVWQTILALGRQDVDPEGLHPPTGMRVLGSSSDHLILDSGPRRLPVGAEVSFQLDYSALLRAMTSPFVTKVALGASRGAELDEDHDVRREVGTPRTSRADPRAR
ncbi:MAG: alanine/ornithine racemase family PLP-dependent enzyme [Planctomycetota bacterium]